MDFETVSKLTDENMALKMEIETLKRALDVNRASCLDFSFEMIEERVKARDLICGQNELIRRLYAKIGFLETIMASEREAYWNVASELELLKFQKCMKNLNL